MNKSKLSSLTASKTGLSEADANSAVDAFFDAILDALANGDTVSLVRFGTFLTRDRAARQGRNPRTGEPIQIAASRLPAFKAGKAFRNTVRKGPGGSVAEPVNDIETPLFMI